MHVRLHSTPTKPRYDMAALKTKGIDVKTNVRGGGGAGALGHAVPKVPPTVLLSDAGRLASKGLV